MELVYPHEKYLPSYREAYAEELASDDLEKMLKEPDIAVESAENERKGEGLPEGWVPATTLWLVDGDKFIGRVNIRHWLVPHLMPSLPTDRTGGSPPITGMRCWPTAVPGGYAASVRWQSILMPTVSTTCWASSASGRFPFLRSLD